MFVMSCLQACLLSMRASSNKGKNRSIVHHIFEDKLMIKVKCLIFYHRDKKKIYNCLDY